MSIVNLKIIFVKKQSAHANAQLKAGGYIYYNRNGRFHTRDGLFVHVRRVIPLMIRVR